MNTPEVFRIRPLAEADLNLVVENAGGVRAHPDADRRLAPGADYQLGEALIELKCLDEEGFAKISRQKKLAAIFQVYDPGRPVIVLDRYRLGQKDQARFDRVIEGPIKTAIAKANRQLKQSRAERADITCSVLMVINNGYTTFDHEAFKALVAHRVRQDTHEIDAVVVAGSYYHSDGLDGFLLWPIDCVPINLNRRFIEFEHLRASWNAFADHFMTQLMRTEFQPPSAKGPVVDTQFEIDGTTYIRPAPVIGAVSEFYVYGRPRKDSSGLVSCPPVGKTFPALSRSEWSRLEKLIPDSSEMFGSYEAWKQVEARGHAAGEQTCPFVTVPITVGDWTTWRSERSGNGSIFQLANEEFTKRVREKILQARELESARIVPSHYVLAITDVIGQDRANDVSHIALISELPGGKVLSREVVKNAKIFHEHAVALAAAYAIRESIDAVMWSKDLSYAWV